MNGLVTDMVDLSKPRPPDVGRVDVAALANEVVSLARLESRAAGDVTISFTGPESAFASCDGAQMRQVLWNLVRNAVQASPAGSEVRVKVSVDAGGIALGVEDEGPGILGTDREKLFDAFYTTRSHGTGIGLAVVKRIVDEHAVVGASLDVASPEGGGAEFRVLLRPA
ncbi:MAG: HAMP domain-containing sensor histidine kinase [Polyangiaceae bacterium]